MIDDVIAGGLEAALRRDAYKRSVRAFHRTRGIATQVVTVTQERDGALTLRAGLYVPELARLVGDAVIATPKEYECMGRTRLGSWITDAPAVIAPLVAEAYERDGRPALDRATTPEAIVDLLRHGWLAQALALPAALLLAGRRDEARLALAELIASKPAPPLLAKAHKLARANALGVTS